MRKQTSKIKETKITQLLLVSILGFGIVITILSFLSIQPNLTNGYFYLFTVFVLAVLYKPFGFFLISKLSYLIHSFVKLMNKAIPRRNEKLESNIDQFNCVEIAEYLKPLFEKQGYKTELAETSKDVEADLIIRKGSKTFVVQAKRKNNKVGAKAIHEVIAAVNHYNANGAIVITNQRFTSSARKLARTKDVKLINRDDLMSMLKTSNKKYRIASALSLILHK